VSLEIVKFAQFLLLHDVEMYDEESNTPMVSNTQTIYENLGQVTHIFSDKTGTLTENVMRFRKMSIGGFAWNHDLSEVRDTCPRAVNVVGASQKTSQAGNEGTASIQGPIDITNHTASRLLSYMQANPANPFSQNAKMFLLSLSLCHTCFPEIERDGKINYQATSPDELALVEAARELGYIVTDRKTQFITISTSAVGSTPAVSEVYEIIDTIEFSPKRRKMSIIVRFPNGRLCLVCKGADFIMKPKFLGFLDEKRSDAGSSIELKPPPCGEWDQQQDDLYDEIHETLQEHEKAIFGRCHQHIDHFAAEGLRTLVFGYRFLNEDEYRSWKQIYQSAATSLVDRQEMIEAAAEIIEQNFELAGATGVEDKLQADVPETIEKLRRANIKIWMLTGDKHETAINIAHSARICQAHSRLVVLHHDAVNPEQQMASVILDDAKIPQLVVVIDGQLLVRIESEEGLSSLFYSLLLRVDSVICCRASPSQKAALVKQIRRSVPRCLTLAIGNGANDVAMIKEAHVGVGIRGKEGLQAARVADYSIAKFRFLQRLLLVHGHWNYVRTANYVLATFWKEMLFYSVQVIYQRLNGYTGTSLYKTDSLAVWNTLFTSLCVILPAIFEQDLSAATLLAMPELYKYGQDSRGFNMKKYFSCMAVAICEGVIIYFMSYILYGLAYISRDQSLFAIGDLAFSACAVFINFKLL
jgi:phospholipid-translocating ATPase